MTANYFLLTKDGLDLDGKNYPPLGQGAGPTTLAALRRNLITNPSFEVNTAGWLLSTEATIARSTAQSHSGSASLQVSNPTGDNIFAEQAFAGVSGKTYTVSCFARTTGAADVQAYIYGTAAGVYFEKFSALSTLTGTGWVRVTVTFTLPAGVAEVYAGAQVYPYTGSLFLDDFLLEQSAVLGEYFDGSTAGTGAKAHAWTGAAHSSVSTEGTVRGVPGELAGNDHLWAGSSAEAQATDGLSHVMPWPSLFFRSVFRVVRDPVVIADDSGDSLGTQTYNHGWVLAHWLYCYLYETRQGSASPAYSTLTWPPQESFALVPVTGTPVVDDGEGYYGMETVTWPGSGVGVGNLRQLLSGDEGATRKVAAILDLLKATTSAQRTTIVSTYAANSAAIINALAHLGAVGGLNSEFELQTPAQRQWSARYMLNGYLGRAAVGFDASTLGQAVSYAMYAITAKEAGLVGGTFTTVDYEAMTEPIDAVLAMPSGY